ncbi:hypothetical protein T492DRAFT_834430 [Pavlovales sp. CCMP2436]|nr:hypothetical protein T492DRAFT_834430 [Pavlovales sp. CCMP2436]
MAAADAAADAAYAAASLCCLEILFFNLLHVGTPVCGLKYYSENRFNRKLAALSINTPPSPAPHVRDAKGVRRRSRSFKGAGSDVDISDELSAVLLSALDLGLGTAPQFLRV